MADERYGMEPQVHDWLAEYRGGNVDALGRLVEHFRRPLYGFILKLTEGRDDAEEIFQEVWFRAIRSLDSYRDKRFLSWLFRIAHNLVIDRARKSKPVDLAGLNSESAGHDPIETAIPDSKPTPDRLADGRDLGTRIQTAIRSLPLEQREVFLMRTEGDIPFKEIAKIQGTSINTSLARMQYALGKLRAELQNDYAAVKGGRP